MFAAFLDDSAIWQPFLSHPVLRASLTWIKENAAGAKLGDYDLGAPGWYANVHGYATLPEARCRWENHRATVDVQYLISGREGIRWTVAHRLGSPTSYKEEKDREEFNAPSSGASLLHLEAGMFAVFLPGDAHCPKIALSESETLRKVVVKIPVKFLTESREAIEGSANRHRIIEGDA